MFPSSPSRAFVFLLRAAALLLICFITQGCQDQGGASPGSGQNMSPYMTKCKEQQVPVPPVWGTSEWVYKGNLDTVFDADKKQYPTTEVWVYVSDQPKGICYALPRKKDANTIGLLGMICQGENGKACFWDNKEPGTNTLITPANGMDPAKEADGSNLIEKCVDCHRGDNAFLITPKTALQQDYTGKSVPPDDQNGRPTSVAKPPYEPISTNPPRPGWINEANNPNQPVAGNVKLAKDSDGCELCHAIPKLTPGYCGLARGMVENHLMPPSGTTKDPDMAADVTAIRQMCNELQPGIWPVH